MEPETLEGYVDRRIREERRKGSKECIIYADDELALAIVPILIDRGVSFLAPRNGKFVVILGK